MDNRIEPGAAGRLADLHWLNAEQNAERRALDGRLAVLKDRFGIPSELKDDLDGAVDRLSRFEKDIQRADELLSEIRTTLMSDTEWHELFDLVGRARSNLPVYRQRATAMLYRLVGGGVLSCAEAGLLKDSLEQLVAGHEYLTSDELPWLSVVRCVEVPLPAGAGTAAAVESRIIPGTTFGGQRKRGHRMYPESGPVALALLRHFSDLDQTRLINVGGQTLFSGLHSALIHFPAFSTAALARMPEEDLRRLIGELLALYQPGENVGNLRSSVEEYCRHIRSCAYPTCSQAARLKLRGCEMMAHQAFTVAIVADPDKFWSALGGAPIVLELLGVSLLTQSDLVPWVEQYTQHQAWRFSPERKLELRAPDGKFRTVEVHVKSRQFALSVEDDGPDFSMFRDLYSNVDRLLGDPDLRQLTGDVGQRVEAMRERLGQLSCELVVSGYEQSRTLAVQALDHAAHVQAASRIAGLKAEIVRVERNARALEQAGWQLKEMWCEHGCWPAGDKAYKAAARLALVGHLMGETPLLSCLSGNDFIRRLDAEVKILATVTDSQDGRLPPVELDMEEWQATRDVLGR